MSFDTQSLREFVGELMREFNEPYPEDIIDRVFATIVNRDSYYARCVELRDTSPHGKYSVNPSIGRIVKEMTGMETVKYPCTPSDDSKKLISSYSLLGHSCG